MAKPLQTRAERDKLFLRANSYSRGVCAHWDDGIDSLRASLESAYTQGYRATLRDQRKREAGDAQALKRRLKS